MSSRCWDETKKKRNHKDLIIQKNDVDAEKTQAKCETSLHTFSLVFLDWWVFVGILTASAAIWGTNAMWDVEGKMIDCARGWRCLFSYPHSSVLFVLWPENLHNSSLIHAGFKFHRSSRRLMLNCQTTHNLSEIFLWSLVNKICGCKNRKHMLRLQKSTSEMHVTLCSFYGNPWLASDG